MLSFEQFCLLMEFLKELISGPLSPEQCELHDATPECMSYCRSGPEELLARTAVSTASGQQPSVPQQTTFNTVVDLRSRIRTKSEAAETQTDEGE